MGATDQALGVHHESDSFLACCTSFQPQSEDKQTDVGCDGKGGYYGYYVAAGLEPLALHSMCVSLREELLVPLLAAEQTGEQDPRPVHCEQCPDGVEFGREDLEHHQSKRELANCGAEIGSLESALNGPDFSQLIRGEHHRLGSVSAELISVTRTPALQQRKETLSSVFAEKRISVRFGHYLPQTWRWVVGCRRLNALLDAVEGEAEFLNEAGRRW